MIRMSLKSSFSSSSPLVKKIRGLSSFSSSLLKMESKLLNCWRCVCTYPFFKCCACAACISGPNSSNSLPHETINTTTTTTSAPGGFEMSFLRDDRTRNSVVIEALPQIIPNHLGPLQNHAVESFRYECAPPSIVFLQHIFATMIFE